jgi:hypothetical protein
VFDGNAVWLEIGVRPGELNDSNAYTTLSPRQEVTPTPYALQTRGIFVDNAGNVGIGTTSPGTKLHVYEPSSSDVYMSVEASSSDGEAGVRLRNPAGGWDVFANNDDGDFGIAHALSDRVLTIKNTTGNVGIGTTDPNAKLEVDGDLKVTGAYKGNISSSSGSDGAPFPRPAYDSGWQSISQGGYKTVTHNIGGNVDNYVVDMQFKVSITGINNCGFGGDGSYGGRWQGLTTSNITVFRGPNDNFLDQVRIRIWVYN